MGNIGTVLVIQNILQNRRKLDNKLPYEDSSPCLPRVSDETIENIKKHEDALLLKKNQHIIKLC